MIYKTKSMNEWIRVSVPVLSLLLLNACTATQKETVSQSAVHCALFGDVCNKLVPGGDDQFSLRYVNPSVQWTSYGKVLIDPVTFWGEESASISSGDAQMLANYFSQQLNAKLGEKFQIVDQAGPGVMKITVAITDAEAATPVLRSVSMIVPQAHVLSNLKDLATGTFPFAGAVQMEAKVADSQTGKIMAAVVARRAGGGSVEAGFQWEWGDAERAIDKWCERTANRLYNATSGKEAP